MLNGGQINGEQINGTSEQLNELTVVLEGVSVAVVAEHTAGARHVTEVATAEGQATYVDVLLQELVAGSVGTTQLFYNPTPEITLSGRVSLTILAAYVEAVLLAGTSELTTEQVSAAHQWLLARAEGTAQTALTRIAEELLAADAGGVVVDAFAVLLIESGLAADAYDALIALSLMDALAASLTAEATMLVSVTETLDAEAVDSVQTLGHYLQNVKDMAGAWLVFKTSGEVVQGWVMNVEEARPFSEYTNFDFNSMTRIGDTYFGAADDGLYTLGGDTDAGAAIDAHVSSMMLDFGTTAQKRVVAAYLGYTSSGTVMLKVRSVDDGKLVEHWYKAAEVTADAPRNGYRPLGRGLKSRYWQFELANVDGADFEIDKLELQPIKLSRRV